MLGKKGKKFYPQIKGIFLTKIQRMEMYYHAIIVQPFL